MSLLGKQLANRQAVQASLQEGVKISVLAEEFREESAYDYSLSYISAQPDESWTLKPVFNIENVEGDIQGNILHRQVYKKLPDPEIKGKTFRWASSGNSKTCPVVEAFFHFYNLEDKQGDLDAGEIRKKYLTCSNEGAILVQVISGPKPEDKGKLRWLPYHTSGNSPFIANMIKNKITPKNKKVKPEDIFDIFATSLIYLECNKTTYAEGGEGRDFGQSSWSVEEKSSILLNLNPDPAGEPQWEEIDLSMIDQTKGEFIDPAYNEAYKRFLEELAKPEISAKNVFLYKAAGDTEGLTEDTIKYVNENWAKVQKVMPIIRNATNLKQITDVLGSTTDGEKDATVIGGGNAQDILKNSADIANLDAQTSTFANPAATTAQQATPVVPQQAETNVDTNQPADGAIDFQNILTQAQQGGN